MATGIPYAAHRYIFGHLLGIESLGRRGGDGYEGTFNDTGSGDPVGAMLRALPVKGLFAQHKEISRELTANLESLSDCYFSCPSCGAGAHYHELDKPYVEYLQQECKNLEVEASRLKHEIAVLQRLADPDLMCEVYEILRRAGVEELQLACFLGAARTTGWNYSEYRSIRKEAEQLLADVAKGANDLALLILKLRRTGIRIPPEVRRLSKPDELLPLSGGPERSALQLLRIIEEMSDDVAAERAGRSRTVDLRTNLLAAAKSLENWPVDFGRSDIDAAIATRQDSKKSAQIRAFGAQLEAAGVKLDARTYRAMAITMCVVADDTEAVVSEDDVRKALKRIEKSKSRKPTKPKNKVARKTRTSSTA